MENDTERDPRESVLTRSYLLAREGRYVARPRLGEPAPPVPFVLGDPVIYRTRFGTPRYGVVAGWDAGATSDAIVDHGEGGQRLVPWSKLTRARKCDDP